MKTNDLEKKIIATLKSNNITQISEILIQIREIGTPVIVNELIYLFLSTNNLQIRNESFSVLCDIKDQNCAEIIIRSVKENSKSPLLKDLLSVCWQSGLDFQEYLDVFVDTFINSEFLVAMEAFSAIQNIQNFTNKNHLALQIEKLQNKNIHWNTHSEKLLPDLILFLEQNL